MRLVLPPVLTALCLSSALCLAIAAPALGADADQPGASAGNAAEADDAWEVSAAAYLWGLRIDGTVAAGPVDAHVDVDFSDILDALDFAFLGALEARRGRLSLIGNLNYLKLASDDERATGSVLPSAPPGSFAVHTVMDSVIVEGAVGYEVARAALLGDDSGAREIALDLRAGFRAMWFENELQVELDPGVPLGPFKRVFEDSFGWADLVIGARIRARPARKLELVVSGDVGGFDIGSSSELSWAVNAFATYALGEHWQLAAGWREIHVEHDKADLRLSGPLIGALYRF